MQSDWREKRSSGIRDEMSRLSKVKEPEITHDESRMKMQEKYRRISERAASTQSAPQAASTKEREEHDTPKHGSNYASPADKLKNPFSTILTKK